MNLLAALGGALLAGGIVMVVMFFRPAPPKSARAQQSPSLSVRWKRISPAARRRIIFSLIVGFLAAVVVSMPLLVVIVPAAWIGLPLLLGKSSTHERDLLMALEGWSRALASTAGTGNFTLADVVSITRGSVPPLLHGPVDRLYARTQSTWSMTDALRAFADELNSVHADEIAIYLIQAAEFNAGGLARALNSVADSIADQVKLRIDLQVERDKPRRVMRTMTIIIGVVVAMIVLMANSEQMALYKTPFGTVLLACILGSFVLLLLWARSIAREAPEPRILTPVTTGQGTS